MLGNKPITREEMYLAKLTGDYTGKVPEPITRKERYLYKESIAEAVQTYLTGKGVGLNMDADGYVSLKTTEVNNNG